MPKNKCAELKVMIAETIYQISPAFELIFTWIFPLYDLLVFIWNHGPPFKNGEILVNL